MKIKALRRDLRTYLAAHTLEGKWEKSSKLFEENIRHLSLHLELLEPRWRGIYSFRLDKKYRALFLIADNKAEVFAITNHYKK
jgi:plasmid maintenance system killer protein